MRWVKLILVISAFLAAINIYFGVLLYAQYKNTYLIDDSIIDDAIALLEEESIIVSRSAVSGKKPVYPVYEGDFLNNEEDYYKSIAARLSGADVTEDLSVHMINNGIRIINGVNGDTFDFLGNNIFSVNYYRGGNTIAADYLGGAEALMYDAKTQAYGDTGEILNVWLYGNKNGYRYGTSNKYLKTKIKKIYIDRDTGETVLSAVLELEGIEICGTEISAVIKDNIPEYLSGYVIFAPLNSSYKVDLLDQVNILFSERAYIKEQKFELEFSLDTPSATAASLPREHILSALKSVYCVSWNESRDKFFLIPAWLIEYNGEIVRIRNAINGILYTI